MKKFYKRTNSGFSVEIWSPEERGKNEPFTLAVYNDDINELTNALINDPNLVELIKKANLTRKDVRKIVGAVLCHRLRLITRKYGLGIGL